MKINKPIVLAVLGCMIALFAFFAIVGVTYAADVVVVNENTNTNTNVINNNGGTATSGSCNHDCYPPVTGSCTVNVTRAETGDLITWKAAGHGGNGYFAYTWSGTDGLSSYYPTISKRYTTAGTKTASVRITSYGETITRTCKVVIVEKEVPNPHENVDGYCVGRPSNVDENENVTWTAYPEGGDGSYRYEWSGTDSLSGTSKSVNKRYGTSGTKTASVRITSDGESITRTCKVEVDEKETPEPVEELDGYCVGRPSNPEEDERVTWTAYPEGGNGSYRYDWSGTDGLDGTSKSISKRYDDEGTKTATVRITSDGDTITRTCKVTVDEEEDRNEDLDAYCKGTPDDAEVGDRIRWTVYADGGDGDFEYEWDGDDNLRGDDKSIYKTYNTSGRKDAEVEVESDGDRVTARCSVDIEKDEVVYTPPTNTNLPPVAAGGIYLSSLPATGISPTLKVALFVAGLLMWSAFLAYLYIARRNEKMKEKEMLQAIGE